MNKDEKDKELKTEELEKLQRQGEEYLNGWKRAQADYQNLKKEVEKEKENWIKFANTGLIQEIIPIYDHLKLAMEHIPEEQKKLDWVVGMGHIKNQFKKFLEDNGVEEIKTVGEKFNPELHEAVHAENKEAAEEEIIKKEISGGYRMNGRVIRVAKVVVG
jgi:molecular chaperone GrpE